MYRSDGMNKFNGSHLFFILTGITIISMKTYPTIYTTIGGRDSWISVICSGLILFAFAYIIITISKKNNNFNIREIYCTALGKTLGTIFLCFFMFSMFLTLVECSSVEANSMHTNMLHDTPPWFFIAFLIIPAIYTIVKGRNSVIIVTIVAIALIIIAGISLAILTQQYKHIQYLFPIMGNGITMHFAGSIVKSLAYLSSFSIILPMLTEFNNKNSLRKYIGWTLVFIIQLAIVSTIGVLTTFGPARLNPIYYPKTIQAQLINYFEFLEGGELYVLLQLLGGWYIKYILTFLSIDMLLEKFNIKNKLIIFIITALVGISAYFCSSNTILLFKLLNIYLNIILVNYFIIPLIVFIIYHFRNKKALENTK
jgi:spore germination protein (amino acid permease)